MINPDRFMAGIKLYEKGKSKRIVFTGGSDYFIPTKSPEGNIYLKAALYLGIPNQAISTTGRVFNTLDEAKAIRKMFDIENRHAPRKIILVTSAFHMKRAKRQFEREDFKVYPFPVDFKSQNKSIGLVLRNPFNWIPNSKYLNSSSVALRELIGRIFYRSW